MAIPVGMPIRWPGARVTSSSMHAHRSMAAAPAVLYWGSGNSRPIFGDTALILSSIVPLAPIEYENKL